MIKLKTQNSNLKTPILKLLSFLIIALTFDICILSLPKAVFAQSSTPNTSPLPANISPTSPFYTDILIHNIFHTFSCLGIGQSIIGQPCLTYQISKNAQGALQSVPVLASVNLTGGILGTTTSLIGALYVNRPVSSIDYLASLGTNLGIIKEAHAQGTGCTSGVTGSGACVLNPILPLWQVSRNVSYVIMILIFLIIGLMVMFRQKINPQTIITAQAALPGLVLGLIMITFSYFLAGLISDTAFLGTNIVGAYFSAVRGDPNPQNLVDVISGRHLIDLFAPLTKIVDPGKVETALRPVWDSLHVPGVEWNTPLALDPQRVLTLLSMFIVTQFVLPFGSLGGGGWQAAVGLGTGVFTLANPIPIVSYSLAFIAMAALIYAMFRLLLRLINSFITIIFLTITAPFQFLFASLPGRQGVASDWIFDMLGNVLVFPAVLAVLYFVAFILGPDLPRVCPPDSCPFKIAQLEQRSDNLTSSVYAQDPNAGNNSRGIIGESTFPLFGGFKLDFINLLLAFGALMALPAIPDVVVRAVGKASQAGELIGREIGSGVGQGQQYARQFREAPSGFAREAGRLTGDPGLIYDPTAPGGWRRPNNPYERATVSRAGQAARIGATARELISGFRKPKL